MPLFSAFTPFGMLRFKNGPSKGEQFYRAGYALKVDAFDMSKGSYEEAKLYAQAMALGRAREALQRGFNQQFPQSAIEMLPALEEDWVAIPSETDSIVDRQNNVLTQMALVRGATREAITTGLQNILGPHLIALRTLLPNEVTSVMPTGNFGPLFARPEIPFNLIRIKAPIATLGTSLVIPYENADETAGPILVQAGDVYMFEPENSRLLEKVTIQAATSTTLKASFLNPHNFDCLATTQQIINYTSTQRSLYIIVDHYAAFNADLLQRINDYMAKVAKSVDTWFVVQPTVPNSTTFGGFQLDVSPLGVVPLTATLINPPSIPDFGFLPSAKTTSQSSVKILGRNLAQVVAVEYLDAAAIFQPLVYSIVSDFEIDTTWPVTIISGADDGFTTSHYPVRMTYLYPDGTVHYIQKDFRIIPAALMVASLVPNSGNGSDPIDAYGTGFLAVIDIVSNGFTIGGYTIVDDTHITAIIPTSGFGTSGPHALQFDDSYANSAYALYTYT